MRRALKVYAFDPTLGRRYGNYMTVGVPYEKLKPGPRGERLEVIDYDATNRRYYKPVDLDDPDLLLQGGVAPAEADPRFHQQMAYAVASCTIENFSFALGRDVQWSRRPPRVTVAGRPQPLRIFPHAMQEANAYYDAGLHALLFGYFEAGASDTGSNLPGQTVFSCLSHDIVAHETAHALVHDLREFFMEPTNPDTLAFHEAFADIVALFQHFTFREAVLDHIRRTGGLLYRDTLRPLAGDDTHAGAADGQGRALRPSTLAEEAQHNVLVGLARQFGEAMGLRAALRSALGSPPDPGEIDRQFEPHARGAILVAAVFDAFFTVYASRMRDLFQIAQGSIGSSGELPAELASRLCGEATKTARHFVNMCVRALDYCPPVDITFGDFLRALITADRDLVADDDRGYRDIVIDAFRRRGIRPTDASSYSESSLVWQPAEDGKGRMLRCEGLRFDAIWGTTPDVQGTNARILNEFANRHARRLMLAPPRGRENAIQARTFHLVHRVGPDGQLRFDIVAELIQRREVPLDPKRKASPRATYRGGTTLVLNARTGDVRYAIFKRLDSTSRLARQRQFWSTWAAERSGAFRDPDRVRITADFAALHRGY